MPSKVHENLKSTRQCWRRHTLSLFYRKGDGTSTDPSVVLWASFGTVAFWCVTSDTHGLYMEGRCLPNTGLEPLLDWCREAVSRLPGEGDPRAPSSLPLTCFGEFWNRHTCGKQCLTWFTGKTIYSSNSPRDVVPEGTGRSPSNQSVITGPSGILLSCQLPQTRTVPSAGHFGWQTIFCPTLFFSFFCLLSFGFLFPFKWWCFLRLMTWRSTWSSRWR